MSLKKSLYSQSTVIIAVSMVFTLLEATAIQAQPPIVQPGAPGEPSRLISGTEASDLAGIRFTDADVKFMQGMISHHAQAIEMTQLLASRSGRDLMQRLARRIELSQEDEIVMMQEWLSSRGQVVTELDAHHAPEWEPMPGMLTEQEMDRLEQAQAVEFDQLFLELMIKHHRGALTMVDTLLAQRGAAQESQLFAFTSDITSDQAMEIDRMDAMLADLSPDPRVQLAAGVHDAGQASWNMALVATRSKPEGFYDPRTLVGRPRSSDRTPESELTEQDEEEEADDEPVRRGLLNFANTDLAFSGDVLFEGNYHGFSAYRVEVPASPQLVSSVVCPGGQGDVSVVGNLLIMSVEQTRGRLDCGLQGVAEPISVAHKPFGEQIGTADHHLVAPCPVQPVHDIGHLGDHRPLDDRRVGQQRIPPEVGVQTRQSVQDLRQILGRRESLGGGDPSVGHVFKHQGVPAMGSPD